MTKNDSYNKNFFKKLEQLKNANRSRYHRLYGEFLGIPEKNIRCFIYSQRSKISRKILELFRERPEPIISDWDMAGKYEEEISERQKDNLRTFIYSMYPDNESSLEKALKLSEAKREKLEQKGVNTEKFIEIFKEENWS